jgi:hypothetical protein
VYIIQKGNTDVEINFYMGLTIRFIELRILYLIWVL